MLNVYVCNVILIHHTDGDQVYSVPRTSNLLARCNSVDDCYYSDSESWLRGNQRTLSSADNEINQTLNKGSDYDSEKETRNPNMHSVKKKPQVLPRLHKPVAAPRKNVSANVTPLHNDTRALTEKNTASAKLLTDNGNWYGIFVTSKCYVADMGPST